MEFLNRIWGFLTVCILCSLEWSVVIYHKSALWREAEGLTEKKTRQKNSIRHLSLSSLSFSMIFKECSAGVSWFFHSWWCTTFYVQKLCRIYSPIQGVPTSLEWVKSNVLMLRSLRAKRATFRKKCILLQKIAFLALFLNCKNENGIFKQLCSNCLM